MTTKHPAAVALGKLGGKSKSPAKLAAAAKNARLGGWPKGRPRKPLGAFDAALKKSPACCLEAIDACVQDTGENIESIIAGVEHEITMHDEGQDGAISLNQRRLCAQYLVWLRQQAQTPNPEKP